MPTAGDVLARKTGDVITIERDASVMEAAKRMNENRIGALIVVHGEQVLGIFTERDVLNRVVAAQKDPLEVPVSTVMTTPMACCTRATKLDECKSVMTNKKIRHLPVVEEGRLFGMISIGDVLANEVAEQASTIQYLSEYLYGRN